MSEETEIESLAKVSLATPCAPSFTSGQRGESTVSWRYQWARGSSSRRAEASFSQPAATAPIRK
jgi:hypothetical protein